MKSQGDGKGRIVRIVRTVRLAGKKEKVLTRSLPSGSKKEADPGRDRQKVGSEPADRHM